MKIKRSTVKYLVALGVFLIAAVLVAIFFHKDIARFIKRLFSGEITKATAKDFMRSFGSRGAVIISILSCLQVVLTFLPAEPVQVVAGMSYGIFVGVGICLIGVFVGNIVMFILSRTVGSKLTSYFNGKIHINIASPKLAGRLAGLVLLMYFLPAIPYGLICFMTASTGMKFHKYILLTTLGSIPSIFIGAGLGVIAIETSWIITLVTFVILVVLIILMFCFKDKLFAAINKKIERMGMPHSTATTVRKPNRFIMRLAMIALCLNIRTKVKIRFTGLKRKERKQLKGSVILSNHPSFMDWYYSGLSMYPLCANYIVARYYYFHKTLGKVISAAGGFPKSMFTPDLESVKNVLRVKRDGGTLCLLPEARLSTVGKSETIQPTTAKMLKMLKMPVNIVKIDGAYLAKPKWGKGFRRGAEIDVCLQRFLTADEVEAMTEKELYDKVTAALYYNELEWLKTKPDLVYKAKNLAEGLENVICRCPKCDSESSFVSSGLTMTCEVCGYGVVMDNRYQLSPLKNDVAEISENNQAELAKNNTSENIQDVQPHENANGENNQETQPPYYENFQVWYDAITEKYTNEIDENYVLKDKVKLKLPSLDGKKFFRLAGEGECTLSKEGFCYKGTIDGEDSEVNVPLKDIYRILFGAGEDFELYHEDKFYYFMPENLRRCVIWYLVSGILKDKFGESNDEE